MPDFPSNAGAARNTISRGIAGTQGPQGPIGPSGLGGFTGATIVEEGTETIATPKLLSARTLYRGVHRDVAKLRANAAAMTMMQVSAKCERLLLEDLTIDMNSLALVGLGLSGVDFDTVEIRRCRFINVVGGTAIITSSFRFLDVSECIFDGAGKLTGSGITVSGAFDRVRISRSYFLGLANGVSIASGLTSQAGRDVKIEGCYFDGMYYSVPRGSNLTSAGVVSYTTTTLTDSAQNFSSLSTFQPIRVLPVRYTGTITASTRTSMTASGSSFSTDIIEGELIRTPAYSGVSNGAQAIIVARESSTLILVEEWLDRVTMQPVVPPPNGTAFTLYKVVRGIVSEMPGAVSGGGQTVGVHYGWSDLNGTLTDPPDGSLYEVLPKGNYSGVHTSEGNSRVSVIGNTFKRSYADQISINADEAIIIGNHISDSQDMGITLNSNAGEGHSIASDNICKRNGAGGIFVSGHGCDVHDNQIVGWCTSRPKEIVTLQSGMVVNGSNIHVHDNLMDGQGLASTAFAIVVQNASNNRISDNRVLDLVAGGKELHFLATVRENVQGNIVRHDGPVTYQAGTAGQLSTLIGDGDPTGVQAAAIGSTYTDRENGKYYVKKVGDGSGGWVRMEPDLLSFAGVSGLVADFDSRYGVATSGGNVTSWTDQVAALVATASGTVPYEQYAGPNGFPYINLTGTSGSDKLQNTTTNLIAAGTARTIFIVCTQLSRNGSFLTFKRGTTGGKVAAFRQADDGAGGAYVYGDGASATNAIASQPSMSTPTLVTYKYQVGSRVVFRHNGTDIATTGENATADDSADTGFIIGAGYWASSGAGSYIARILVFNSVLNAQDTATVESALAQLYGIVVAG